MWSDRIFKDEMDYAALARVSADFIDPFSDVIGVRDKEGNWIEDNRFMLGTWAGPSKDIYNLIHEIAHMVEIDDKRCHLPGWGLKYPPEFYWPGHGMVSNGFNTAKAIYREARVLGIQEVITKHYGIVWNRSYSVSSLKYIDGMCFIPPRYPENPKDDTLSYDEREKRRMAYLYRFVIREARKHTFESVLAEYGKKIGIIRKRQRQNCWRSYQPDNKLERGRLVAA